MSNPEKQPSDKPKSPAWKKLLKVLYILLFAISLVIVVVFIAFRIIVHKPDVDSQVTFAPNPGPSVSLDPDVTPGPSDAPSAAPIVLTRQEGVYTCLLLGVANQGGSDTIMLGVFDTNTSKASLISIPRDTLVMYDGSYCKINAIYSYGGVEAIVDAVHSLLGLPIDFYVSVNTRAFRAIVNEIGGIWFTVPVDMKYSDPDDGFIVDLDAGYQWLNGEQAEGVVRCRNCYTNADIGRTATQRAFLTALIKQTITLSNVTKVRSLINILNTYVVSDMPLNTMIYFGTQAIGMDLDTDMVSKALPGDWVYPYYELFDEQVLELVNSLGVYEEEVPPEVLSILHR